MESQEQLLRVLARKYCWWKSEAEALLNRERIISQVMTMGTYADVQALLAAVGEGALRNVLKNAEAGQFDPRSWNYWHYRLRLAEPEQVPPLPTRRVA